MISAENYVHEALHIVSSYGILCHWDNFSNDTSFKEVRKYCHPNLHSCNEILTNFGIFFRILTFI